MFVMFKSPEKAKAFLDIEDLKYKDTPLVERLYKLVRFSVILTVLHQTHNETHNETITFLFTLFFLFNFKTFCNLGLCI